MTVVPWRGPPPFAGCTIVMLGVRHPLARPTQHPVNSNPDGSSEQISLIERWGSHEPQCDAGATPSG